MPEPDRMDLLVKGNGLTCGHRQPPTPVDQHFSKLPQHHSQVIIPNLQSVKLGTIATTDHGHHLHLPQLVTPLKRNHHNGQSVSAILSQSSIPRPSNKDEVPFSSASPASQQPSSSSSSPPPSPPPCPPSFSSLYSSLAVEQGAYKTPVTAADPTSVIGESPAVPVDGRPPSSAAAVAETKAALPPDTKREQSGKGVDDGEPPPPYTEGSSPLDSFTYLMAAAGGPSSLITQVQQGGPPINTLGDVGADENINLDLRGTRFTLSRDELLTLPEFVLLSLFPNGLLPDGHMNTFQEGDIYPVDYDPASLQYMLDFFRTVAQTIPSRSPSPTSQDPNAAPVEQPIPGSARDMLQDRAGIIVLREDLDFYAIPPHPDIDHAEMIEVKRAAGQALLRQDGIFSGLRRSEETGTTEQHLIEMLTAGGFDPNSRWGHRASEPNKAVICSLALARLRTDVRGSGGAGASGSDLSNSSGGVGASNAVGMAQKLLLFWRKPARRCWWEGVELEGVEGVQGKLKVWIRRVWTLEMSVIGLR
ncbi:MAG: hypothetical protein M1833_007112 [Piccolia ochrophora]|nr:MAG: hypothetical protein M1833_007112 [Piccolia ochrophora]